MKTYFKGCVLNTNAYIRPSKTFTVAYNLKKNTGIWNTTTLTNMRSATNIFCRRCFLSTLRILETFEKTVKTNMQTNKQKLKVEQIQSLTKSAGFVQY